MSDLTRRRCQRATRAAAVRLLAVLAVSPAGFALAAAAQTAAAAGPKPVPAAAPAPAAPRLHIAHAALSRLGWQFVCPSSVFPQLTCFELIDRLHAQTVHHLELAPGQALSVDRPGAVIGAEMAAADLDALRAKLHAVRMDIVSFGPVAFGKDEAAMRRVFAFASRLRVRNIVADSPSPDSLPLLDRLATEYGIGVALAGRPGQSCDALLPSLEGRSSRIGFVADVAAWRRGGADPLACLRKLDGHILEVRLGDVNAQGRNVPLGTGAVGAEVLLDELKNQNFRGAIVVSPPEGGGAADPLAGGWAASVNAFSNAAVRLAPAAQTPDRGQQ